MTQQEYDAAYEKLCQEVKRLHAAGTRVKLAEAWFERSVDALDKRFMSVTA